MTTQKAIDTLTGVVSVERAHVGPSDVVVVSTDEILSADAHEHARQWLQQIWPHNQVVVLGRGISLKVVGEAKS